MNRGAGHRILIVGDSNAGKSTLAARLASALAVPFVELDALYWLPNWQARTTDEFRQLLSKHLPAEGSWVAAGNYSFAEVHWLRADTIVWLDYPLRITVPRIIRRSWQRWRSRELLWGTNHERLLDQFALWDEKKSLITFTVRLHRRRRAGFAAFMRDPRFSHVAFTRLERPAAMDAWLHDVLAALARPNS